MINAAAAARRRRMTEAIEAFRGVPDHASFHLDETAFAAWSESQRRTRSIRMLVALDDVRTFAGEEYEQARGAAGGAEGSFSLRRDVGAS